MKTHFYLTYGVLTLITGSLIAFSGNSKILAFIGLMCGAIIIRKYHNLLLKEVRCKK